MEPPGFAGAQIPPGTVDPRWHVVVSWFSDNIVPPGFAAAEMIPEQPVRMVAARDPGQNVAAIQSTFEARKLAKLT